jgi:3-phenylpropionate/trans-cinnamate dioxygenase ferredoxin subunit
VKQFLLCAVDDIAPATARRFDIDHHRIALVRLDDDFYAIGDTCSHADYSLSEGEVNTEERTLECWKHGSQFSVDDGHPVSLPATRPVPVYKVHVEEGSVYVSIEVGDE